MRAKAFITSLTFFTAASFFAFTATSEGSLNGPFSNPVDKKVADCIRVADITPGSDFAIIVEQLDLLSNVDVNKALFNLSPVNYGALDWINARNNSFVAHVIAEHQFQLCCSPRNCCSCSCNMGFWFDVFGNFINNKKHFDFLSPFEANAVGVVTGFDLCFCQNFTIGLAGGYTHTALDWLRHHGHGEINSYYGALYGSYRGCIFNFDLSAIGGASDHDLKRKVNIEGIRSQTILQIDTERTAKSNPWGYFATVHFGASTHWLIHCMNYQPFAVVDWHCFHRDRIKEHGAGDLDLRVKDHDQEILRGEIGIKFYRAWAYEWYCFAPYLSLSWVGEWPLDMSFQKARFEDQSCKFKVRSYHSNIQYFSPEVGIKWTRNSGTSMLIGYKGMFSDKVTINAVEARLEWVF